MTPTRFDIYVRQGGRWQRTDSWPGNESESALASAASMDANGGFDGVRVMAVVEYGSGRAPLETLSWISPHLSSVAAVKRQLRDQAAAAEKAVAARAPETEPPTAVLPSDGVSAPVAPSPEAPPPSKPVSRAKPAKRKAPKPPPSGIGGKLVVNGLIAFAVATVSFVPFTAIFRNFGAQANMDMVTQQRAGASLSLIVFVVMASWLMGRVYRNHRAYVAESAPQSTALVKPTTVKTPPPSNVSNVAPMPYYLPDPGGDDETPTQEPDVEAEAVAEAYEQEQAGAPEQRSGGGLTETMRRAMLEFLAMALAAIKDEVPRMNQHVAFGLNLFGAGAAERYGEYVGLSRIQGFVLIREMIEVLGNSADRVDAFCRQFAEYAAQERYQMMINAGRDSMSKRINGDPAPFADFHDAINMWTSDTAARAQSQGVVCIMFTDIVGSTQMTHEHGDYAAQDVVRVHNAIVRSALAAHHGREVKHTGDGIMASFTSAANAVRATIEVQRALLDHKSRNNALGVNVRIGLNAGEAVQEEDDFFGTTVQLAARVCDKAGTGEIFVTENVRELAKGQGIDFSDAGKFAMKGVPKPMTLYRVSISSGSKDDADSL